MTPRERCLRLLEIHHGACSVRSDTALGAVFVIMEIEGAVTTRPSGTPGYVDIYKRGFKSRFMVKGEI